MLKQALLCAACAISLLQLSAQPTVPQLSNVGVGTPGAPMEQLVNITEDGYVISTTWFEYCTSVTCWNDGVVLTVRDSNMKSVLSLTFQREVLQMDQSTIDVKGAVIDADNNLIIAGRFRSDINFAPADANAVNLNGGFKGNGLTRSLFLAKYRLSDGHLFWIKTMGGEDMVFPGEPHIATDEKKNIYMYVGEGDDVDIDPGPAVSKVKKGLLAKFNTNGDYLTYIQAEKTYGTIYKPFKMMDKKLYLLGIRDSTYPMQSFAFQQYDPENMKVIKSKNFGFFKRSPNWPGYMQMSYTVDKADNVWLMASYTESCSIGNYTQTLTSAQKEQLIVKLDNNLNVTNVWPVHRTINNATYAAGFGIDSLGNLLVIGTVRDSIDVDLSGGTQWVRTKFPPPYSSGAWGTLYFNCYDKNMNLLWTKTMGDTSLLWASNIEFGHRKNIYILGAARGAINFDLSGNNTVTVPPANQSAQMNMTSTYVRYKWNTARYTTDVPNMNNRRADVSLYPNPATSVLNVNLGKTSGKRAMITIADINGRILQTMNHNGGNMVKLPVDHLVPGSYLMSIEAEGYLKETRQFVKQ